MALGEYVTVKQLQAAGGSNSMNDTTKQFMDGTDKLSIARGLAYGLLFTWTHAAHELSECLFRGETDAEDILSVMRDCVSFVENNSGDFTALCREIQHA